MPCKPRGFPSTGFRIVSVCLLVGMLSCPRASIRTGNAEARSGQGQRIAGESLRPPFNSRTAKLCKWSAQIPVRFATSASVKIDDCLQSPRNGSHKPASSVFPRRLWPIELHGATNGQNPKMGTESWLFRGGYNSMIPRFNPRVTAWVRSLAPSLERMLFT
jgi:hypothetical protein